MQYPVIGSIARGMNTLNSTTRLSSACVHDAVQLVHATLIEQIAVISKRQLASVHAGVCKGPLTRAHSSKHWAAEKNQTTIATTVMSGLTGRE